MAPERELFDKLGIHFKHRPEWERLFDIHTRFIQDDIRRALASDRVVVYLSCPISARFGSLAATNIDVADATARRLTTLWGDRFWFLNPAQYQLESPEGTGYMARHARQLKDLDFKKLLENEALKPTGGDYMRMWTRVLAEDGRDDLGDYFSAFYFIGPSDYWHFFTEGGTMSLSSGVETYFARKLSLDSEVMAYFTPTLNKEGKPEPTPEEAEIRRKEFIRYYTVRAGAAFSRGSHDEWNLWVALNRLRMERYGVGNQIPGFFEGRQIDPGSAVQAVEAGYAEKEIAANKTQRLPDTPKASAANSRRTAHDNL